MHHYGLLEPKNLSASRLSLNLGHAVFGIRHQFHPRLSWSYEGGIFISTNDDLAMLPTFGFGIHWYVF